MPRRNPKKPLPGFPRKEKFKSREEVDNYFASEKIQCLLCGWWFRWISPLHLRHVHGISTDDYKEKYGLPWTRGLLGTLALKEKEKHAKRLRAEGKLKNPPKDRKRGSARERPIQPFVMDSIISRALAVHGKNKQYSREDFEKILERMQKEKRILNDVCGDPDLPSRGAWGSYVKKHPDLKERVHRIHHGLSYSLQARARDLSPRFSIECQRLRARGESVENIAGALNVSSELVLRILKEASPDFRPLYATGPQKWHFEDYEAILERMRDQERSLTDVCKDPDLPSIDSMIQFKKNHPEFENKFRELRRHLPYPLQIKTGNLSPRFAIDCIRLRSNGMSMTRIGRVLGGSITSVKRVLRDHPDRGLPARVNPAKKWRRKDYEAILERMRRQERTLSDVCNDEDLPSYELWRNYKNKHPEFVEKYLQVLWSLPIHVQLKARSLSPELLSKVQRMQSGGMTCEEIADDLGVTIHTVNRFFEIIRKRKS